MAKDLGVKTSDSEFYFISYNSEDSWRVAEYAQKLVAKDINVWYDKSLKYGKKWAKRIGEKIHASKGIIIFFTQGIIEKEDDSFVIKEFEIAKNQDKDIYVYFIDPLNKKENSKKHPGISDFIVDIDSIHTPQNFDELVFALKGVNTCKELNNEEYTYKDKKLIKGPEIFDSKYLIDEKIITTEELSKRHVELDYLVVDKEKFPDAIEAEGDPDYWIEMTSDTSDCCANLIIDGVIVGYMDFIPVKPDVYVLLQTEQFKEEHVAFYTSGGKFNIFVSMFSVERNYSGQTNLLLFIKWMAEKILKWKEKFIEIGKIEFCIYSQNQARIFESIGAKHILTSQLKGMMYEIKVEDLLNSNLYELRKLGNYYDYILINDKNPSIIKECKKITLSLHVSKGGMLQYKNAVEDSDFIIAAKNIDNKIIGYICLKKYDILENSLYVEQIAVKKDYQDLGIGKHLLQEAIKFAENSDYDELVANCKKINKASISLFTKLNFEKYNMSAEIYEGIGIDNNDIKKNHAFRIEL